MMGKSIMEGLPQPRANALERLASSPADSPQRRNFDGQVFQAATHTLERRGFSGLDLFETLERRGDAGARHDHNAIAIADYDIAGGDRNAPADNREPDGPRAASLRRIRRDAHRIDRKADRFEVGEVAHKTVGDETGGSSVACDPNQ